MRLHFDRQCGLFAWTATMLFLSLCVGNGPVSAQIPVNDWTPEPWSGDWYEPYAKDRHAKQEAGEIFTNHFAHETALATVPPEWVHLQLPENISGESVTIEVVITPDGKSPETAQDHNHSTNAAPRSFSMEISRSRLNDLAERIATLIDDFQEESGEENYLAENRTASEKITAQAETLPVASKEFAELFAEMIRVYWRTATANPLLDFDRLIFIERNAAHLGLPQNYESNSSLPTGVFHDRLMTLTLPETVRDPNALPVTSPLFEPDYATFLGDLDLHFDAEKLLVSSMDRENRWNVFEIDLSAAKAGKTTGETMRKVLPDFEAAANYDACYLPDESIIFESSGCYIAVPCMSGSTRVTNTFRRNADGTIRRLTFDQEHNWCPTLLPDGRVLYTRWEYTDIPHVSGRILFQMNPDGTGQTAVYGSNSLWPVSMMYAKPIPGDPSRFVAIVTGHHGVPRMGELVLFDVQKGRKDESGAVERICGSPKKVESRTDPKYYSTLTGDNIVDESWPKFLQPIPLSEDYYLVTAQPAPGDLWGIYLADRHDNLILLCQKSGLACMEPVPWRTTERPPVIMDRVDLSQKDATVYIADLYFGPGLAGIPRGTVKNLRISSYNYLYPGFGGWSDIVGVDGPWDVRTILGTVPVNGDGSALFKVPANVPIAIQPLDEHGTAVQQMRSWFTAMPGENVSCIGCHEDKNSTSPVSNRAFQSGSQPAEIRPWYGPARGFSYEREVQPVLDHYCTACHDGEDHGWGSVAMDLRGGKIVRDFTTAFYPGGWPCGSFSTSYLNLQRYVRRMGQESDADLLMPMEFAANSTELVQLLRDNHYGLLMDAEAWDRILTWIDLNTPYHGTWTAYAGPEKTRDWDRRRGELLRLYADIAETDEHARGDVYDPKRAGKKLVTDWSRMPVSPLALDDYQKSVLSAVAGGERAFPDGNELLARFEKESLPLDPKQMTGKNVLPGVESAYRETWSRVPTKHADRRMNRTEEDALAELPAQVRKEDIEKIPLADGIDLFLTRIPGQDGKSLLMGTFEITNAQFELFDPSHDSRVESRIGLSHGIRGFYVNAPELPVCRVSWNDALAFCDWLSQKTGRRFRLPTASEWEYAARAGTATPFPFGDWNADFSFDANLADQMLIEFVCDMYVFERVPLTASYYDDWFPKDERFCDDGFLSERPGQYRPNAWGLFDMIGNVAEWTATEASPKSGLEMFDAEEPGRIVRGGSWRDRPYRATADFETAYKPWQRLFNVGFRVICE